MRLILFAAFLMLATAGGTPAHAACGDGTIKIRAPILSSGDKAEFETHFRRSLKRVCRWWGETYDGAFTIDIDESRGPSMALVPAWRGNHGEMLFRAGTVRLGRAAITHEIAHVLAPNANRFLAEGLAVYIHDDQRGQPAYPNFGKDLTSEARRLAPRADIAALERLATPTRLKLPDLDSRDAYIVAGSFVGFLVEQHGMEKFRTLYAMTPLVARERNAGKPERWQKVYEVSLEELTAQWRTAIKQSAR
ncbi:MAG: hypothetical protein GKS02_04385 [Alphaproteobacteria bacterium]|nr:hypothetical protein [Alphaproteobacteria bacterium]